ncbi:MAG TPA: class I SAM-dependent methyltransferase [Chthoniobacterales bacterium]|nr:class I SAM-dependent methyltransferase [Chthoniobacterales bacterium]
MKSDLEAEFAKLAPWVFQFEIDGAIYGGGVSATGDIRVEQFFDYVPKAATILELGSLEGAQTFIMAQRPGVTRVVALEGREFNLRKARFVQELLRIPNAEFVQANLEDADLAAYGKFDAVFCSGLLYHLPEPWKLIAQLPAIAPALFIWTQYAKEEEATEVAPGLRGKICPEGGSDEPLSGMSATATWLTLDSLITLLKRSGYGRVDLIKDDPGHSNGPAVAVGARIH